MRKKVYGTLLRMLEITGPFFLMLAIGSVAAIRCSDYRRQRSMLLHEENSMALGGRLRLEPGEREVNDMLMAYKRKELAEGFKTLANFIPARNFLESSKDFEESKVFRYIKWMPKGAVLHTHASAIASKEFVFGLTYRDNLYVCEEGDGRLALRFFDKPNKQCEWKLLSDLRKDPNKAKFLNDRIQKQLSMVDDPSLTKIERSPWSRFQRIFEFITPMLKYRPVFEEHFYKGLEELSFGNVIYLELRATLRPVYELNGTEYGPVEVARIYRDVAEEFVRHNPSFVGVKLIYAPIKTSDSKKFDEFLGIAQRLKKELPDFFAGFDLVGQEDTSPSLSIWVDKLQTIGKDIPFFFHAGETNWNGQNDSDNLITAVLLNTKRIGHGYALVKHPRILELVKEKKIAVEICPISNQVLGLVKDLRNHPASVLFADNFPVVVSNDDPGVWGASDLSYDFYEAFMGIMSAHADLRSLKQLAINSIQYSSLNSTQKTRALSIWKEQWQYFIEKLTH